MSFYNGNSYKNGYNVTILFLRRFKKNKKSILIKNVCLFIKNVKRKKSD